MKTIIKKLIPHSIIKTYRRYRKRSKKRKEIKFYAGDNVVCPICKSTFRKFAPHGLSKRENARCPNCNSVERHRLVWKYLNDKTDLFKGAGKIKLLHFAPEYGFYAVFSKDKRIEEYVPCDIFPEYYDFGKIKAIKVDITDIPFGDNYFDVILCNDVLEHIPDDAKAMAELYRVMKKGGFGIFQVPIDYNRETTYEDFTITTLEGREKAFGQKDHVRWYGRDYKDRLAKAGFDVTEDDYVNSFSAEELHGFGILASKMVYYCKK